MSSKRAVTSLLRASTRAQQIQPARLRTLTISQTLSAARPLQQLRASTGTIRPFSQSASSESKIYNFEDVQKLVSSTTPKVTLIDVREPGEVQQTGHIPQALNVPITSYPDSFHISAEEFEDRFGFPRPNKGDEVVFYCKSGVRSRGAAGIAKDAGWEKVGEYPGSWSDWFGKGGKVER